jgi:hypothetical protein
MIPMTPNTQLSLAEATLTASVPAFRAAVRQRTWTSYVFALSGRYAR